MRKSAELVIDRTVILIIAVMVIVLVTGIFISFNPNFLYKLLPDLAPKVHSGDEVIEGADVLTATCNNGGEIVGYIGQGYPDASIFMIDRTPEGGTKFRKTSLYYRVKSQNNAEIVVNDKWTNWRDTVFGYVKDGFVVIYSTYWDGSDEYFNKHLGNDPLFVDLTELKYLSGSSFEGGIRFCKVRQTS